MKGLQVTFPEIPLVTGEITNDKQLDVSDYNILISCFESKLTNTSCPAQYQLSNSSPGVNILDDDGQVEGGDYNEFLRQLAVQRGD